MPDQDEAGQGDVLKGFIGFLKVYNRSQFQVLEEEFYASVEK